MLDMFLFSSEYREFIKANFWFGFFSGKFPDGSFSGGAASSQLLRSLHKN